VFCNSNFITTTLLSLILITSGLLQFAGKITITSDQFSSLLLERVWTKSPFSQKNDSSWKVEIQETW
jgi:hypothetical protein